MREYFEISVFEISQVYCIYTKVYRISSLIRQYFFFYFQNNPKILDLSYKTDLDLWGCLGRVNFVLQQNCIGLI